MQSAEHYAVWPYAPGRLEELLAENSEAPLEVVKEKSHAGYFADYFDEIGAQTIVVEYNYTDRDFLEDFAGYYVRCFHDYKSTCVRLHFFSTQFTQASFHSLLSGRRGMRFRQSVQDGYLGFIVVKPLPWTLIGRTCLKTYPPANRRYFPITRPYSVSLFGLRLSVESTLAFQEQDTVAAACATSALWSTFQGTGKRFQHPIPSPVEITRAALSRFPSDERDLPNHGLRIEQMAHAIRSVGLESFPVRVSDDYSAHFCLQSTAYAYLRGGYTCSYDRRSV